MAKEKEYEQGFEPNTPAQIATHKAAEAAWAEELTWPIWQVEITGDEVEWVARPGVNLDENDEPQPWTAVARATVTCHAKNETMAGVMALSHNSEYHTIESIKEIKAD